MSFELPSSHDVLHGAAEFGQGLFYGAVEMPIDGITQLFNKISPVDLPTLNIVDETQHNNTWFKAGVAGGIVLDTVLLSSAVNAGFASYAETHAASAPFLKAAVKGFTLGATQPVAANDDYWQNKGLNTGLRVLSGQAGAGINKYAGGFGIFGDAAARSAGQELAFRGITGLPKGVFSLQMNSLAHGNGFAGPVDTIMAAAKSSVNGMLGGAANELVDHLTGDEVQLASAN